MPSTPATATSSESAPNPRARRHTRTRNGCERCRTQRRKCDETKPQCKRCMSAGVACKYVVRIAFLDQHVKSTPIYEVPEQSVPGQSKNTGSAVYSVINFVNHGIFNQDKACSSSEDNTQSCQQRVPLDALSCERSHSASHVQQFQNIEPTSQDRQLPEGSELSQTMKEDRELSAWPLVGHSPLSSDELNLLKSYIHIVTPSLDVYDNHNTFRHHLTALSMNSPCLLEKSLRLSAALTSQPSSLVKTRGIVSFRIKSGYISALTAIRLMGSFSLDRALLFAESCPDEWDSGFYRDHLPPISTARHEMDATQKRMWCGILTLIARLEIAASLINGMSCMSSSALLDQVLSSHYNCGPEPDPSQRCLNASVHCLKLLSDVMALCLPSPGGNEDRSNEEATPTSTSRDNPRDTQWKELWRKLLSWRHTLPVALEELISLDGPNDTLPTIVYASGGGISTNILYHTAMCMLLSKRPKSGDASELGHDGRFNEEQLSSSFHARRVCGIALNGEAEHSHFWDPCTIAALSFISRQVTDSVQQEDMAMIAGRVKKSGWPIDQLFAHSESTTTGTDYIQDRNG